MKNRYFILGLLLLSSQVIFCSNSIMDFSIGGTITEDDGTPVENAKVYLSDDVFVFTDADGKYLFTNLKAGLDYTIQANKADDFRKGLTPLDAYVVRHNQGPNHTTIDSLSSYDLLISDLNNNEEHDVIDLFSLHSLIVKQYAHFLLVNDDDSPWRFISTDFDFQKELSEQTVKYQLKIKDLQEDSFDNDFYGFKIGDVAKEENFIKTDIKPTIEISSLQTCEERVIVPVTLTNLKDIIGCQFEISWDTTTLQLINAGQPVRVPIIQNNSNGIDITENKGFAVISAHRSFVPINDTVVLNFEFSLKGNQDDLREIKVDPIGTEIQFLNKNLELSGAEFINGGITVCSTVSAKNIDFSNEKIELFPNPAKEGESTFIKIENPDFKKGNIVLTNISGKEIWEQRFQNETLIGLPDHLSKGLYFISVSIEHSNRKNLKLIVE